MDSLELKKILIEELGTLPYANKKKIDKAGTIPEDLFEKIIKKTEKRKKLTMIMTIIISILIAISFFLSYWFKEDNLSFILFIVILVFQIFNLHYHSDFKDYSKKQLIFRLFKTIKSTENNSKTD